VLADRGRIATLVLGLLVCLAAVGEAQAITPMRTPPQPIPALPAEPGTESPPEGPTPSVSARRLCPTCGSLSRGWCAPSTLGTIDVSAGLTNA
jgi:hypothetical protein